MDGLQQYTNNVFGLPNRNSSQPVGYSPLPSQQHIRPLNTPYSDNGLTDALGTRFSDTLPTYNEFKTLFREAYTHNYVSQELEQRPGVGVIDGIVRELAENAGFNPRQISRWEQRSPYIKDILDSVKLNSKTRFEDVKTGSDAVAGILDYREIVGNYRTNNPFYQRLESLVQNPADASELKQKDIQRQIEASPLKAQLYAAMDRALTNKTTLKDSWLDARSSYLTLVAFNAGYDANKIKETLGKESTSTTVARFYERAGLPFKEMIEVFNLYNDRWRPEVAEQNSASPTARDSQQRKGQEDDAVLQFERRQVEDAKRQESRLFI